LKSIRVNFTWLLAEHTQKIKKILKTIQVTSFANN
jgi:hypothetical protein